METGRECSLGGAAWKSVECLNPQNDGKRSGVNLFPGPCYSYESQGSCRKVRYSFMFDDFTRPHFHVNKARN